MNMGVLELYDRTRSRFPEITEKADREHIRLWDQVDPESAYSWFESLANALNSEMLQGIPAEDYRGLFEFISSEFTVGSDEVRDCIDVSFTENLFWRVPAECAKPYWANFPRNLRELYVRFHGKAPL